MKRLPILLIVCFLILSACQEQSDEAETLDTNTHASASSNASDDANDPDDFSEHLTISFF